MLVRGWKSAALNGGLAAMAAVLFGAAAMRCAPAPPPPEPSCTAELRSWVVAGRARHLYLELSCPPPFEHHSGRIEFTSAALRRDYSAAADRADLPRLARMTPGRPLAPPSFAPPPDGRLEARYRITPEQAAALQRDRVFNAAYVLLCANSNAALRRVMESCGLALPIHVTASAGITGEFPGINCDSGAELPLERWRQHGIESR